jgi:CRISPR/Cas system endoribonuclease Cas6 (RAMP superfamily)
MKHDIFSLFRDMMMLFRCFAKHLSPKRAGSRNSETSETTPLVLRNSETHFAKPFAKRLAKSFRQKSYSSGPAVGC